MGVKSGSTPWRHGRRDQCGLGHEHPSRDKFPRAILPRTFDCRFCDAG